MNTICIYAFYVHKDSVIVRDHSSFLKTLVKVIAYNEGNLDDP